MTDTTKPKYLYGWTDQNASPTTVYTDSTTLTLGMPLYDNTGTDTGLTVDTINQDGTFDINTRHTETVNLDQTTVGMIPSGVLYAGVTYEIKIVSATSTSGDGRTFLRLNGNAAISTAYTFISSATITNYVGAVFYYTPTEDLYCDPANQKYSSFWLTSSNTNFAGSVTLEVSWG